MIVWMEMSLLPEEKLNKNETHRLPPSKLLTKEFLISDHEYEIFLVVCEDSQHIWRYQSLFVLPSAGGFGTINLTWSLSKSFSNHGPQESNLNVKNLFFHFFSPFLIIVFMLFKTEYSYWPVYHLPCTSSQVDLRECKNITVFLAPSVVSSTMNRCL